MKKCLVSIIAVMMMFSVVTPIQFSSVSAQEKTSTTVEKGSKERVPAFQSEVELVEERTSTSQVFKQADGAHRMEISPEPIHVQNEKTKKWEPIDNKLIEKETGRFHNAKNEFDASFSPDSQSKEPLVSLEQQGKTVAIESMEQNGDAVASVEALIEENKVTYEDVYPHTDLIYTVGNDKVKEDILLKEKPTAELPLSYDFEFKIEGLVLEETEDGYFFLADKKTNELLFAIEKPFMMDSLIPEGFVTNMEGTMPEGALSDSVKMTASQKGDVLSLSLAPDMEWLLDPERIYPVTIDPTIKMYQPKNDLNDTTIRSALPDTTGGADTELGTGLHKSSTTNNIVRSLIQFDTGTLPKGAKVMSAQLNLHLSSVWNDTPTSIQLFEAGSAWEENRATWNRRTLNALWSAKGGDYKQPSLASQTIGVLNPALPEPPMYKWVIAPEVAQKWMDQPTQNLGLMLKAQNETIATYKKFYSGDASGTTGALKYSPKLSIVYYPISRLGIESYWSYFNHELSDGQGSVNVGTGNLVVDTTDFFVSGRGNSGLDFSRTYNSKAVEDAPLGYGWSFTGSETVSEFPNRDALYQDADGTTHLFVYNATTGTYATPKGLYQTLTKANADALVLTDFNGNRTVFRDLIKNLEVQSHIYQIDYEEDRNKNRTTYQRRTDGTLTGIMDASGRTLTFTYQNGRVVSTQFEGTKKTAYTYKADGRLETVTNFKDTSSGTTTTYRYDTTGLLSSIIDGNAETTHYLYENGFLKTVKQPTIAAIDSTITYDYNNLANFVVNETDALSNKTIYRVSDNYLITSVTNPLGQTNSYNHDSQYNVLKSADPKGGTITSTYDAKGNSLSTTDSLGNKVFYSYNGFSQPLTMTDTNGTVTYSYNSTGDLLTETNPLGEVTTYTYYEPYGNLKTIMLPDGTIEHYEYDSLQNHPIKTKDALNRTVSVTNDKYGKTTQFTDARGNKTYYKYDELNQLNSTTDSKGITTSYNYDPNGNITSIQNGRGQKVKLGYNAQNQFTSRTEPLGQKTTFRYDAAGNLIEEIKPDGMTSITTAYNRNNLPEFIRLNGLLKWQFTFDSNGNTTSVKNGETGAASSFEYDANDRLKIMTTGIQKVELNYSATDKMTSIKGSSGTTFFTQGFAYDMNNQLKNTYRNGSVQAAFDYKPTGALAERRYVNGVHTFFTYDAGQQLNHLKVAKGTLILLDEINRYDLNGNLTGVTSTSSQKTFDYDALNQLENQHLPELGLLESYTYDIVGNRLSKNTVANGITSSTSYVYNVNNQLINVNGQSYEYDANGNRTKDSKYFYVYNQFNQLTSVKNLAGSTVASYTYDDKGRRISKTSDGKTTYFHYGEGIQVLFETNNTGTITVEYQYDSFGYPLTLTKNGNSYYYVYNSNGEITSLTDSTGSVVASYEYDAWGNILSQDGLMASENPYRYKRYYYDDETKFYYLTARYYQPTEAVFLASDPWGGDSASPEEQNGYNYVSNNPLNYVDHNGEKRAGDYGGASGGFSIGGAGLTKGTSKGSISKSTKNTKKLWDIKKNSVASLKYKFNGQKVTAYKDSTKKGYWWAKDTTGHADTAFKVFEKRGNELHWVADADKYGNFIKGKHKSKTGTVIKIK